MGARQSREFEITAQNLVQVIYKYGTKLQLDILSVIETLKSTNTSNVFLIEAFKEGSNIDIAASITRFILDNFTELRTDTTNPNLYYINSDLNIGKKFQPYYSKTLEEHILIFCATYRNTAPDPYKNVIDLICANNTSFIDFIRILRNSEPPVLKFSERYSSVTAATTISDIVLKEFIDPIGDISFGIDSDKKDNTLDSINEAGSVMLILRSIFNEKLTEFVCSDKVFMKYLFDKACGIDKELLRREHRAKITLKGGNVFKLKKKEFLQSRPELKHMSEESKVLTNKLYDSITPEKFLSDWDFSVSFKDQALKDEENAIFTNSTKSPHNLMRRNPKIKNILAVHNGKYDTVNLNIINMLKHLQTNVEFKGFVNIINNKIIKEINGGNFTLEVPKEINNTYTYPQSYRIDRGGGIRFEEKKIKRNKLLNATRDYKDFKAKNNMSAMVSKLEPIRNTNIKIADMEIVGVIPVEHAAPNIVEGFDLTRLNITLHLNYKMFESKAGYKKQLVFAELFDFSHSKPFTYGNFVHGEEKSPGVIGDFSQATFVDRSCELQSYNEYWFIKDIIRISNQGMTAKFEKRVRRLFETLLILICNKKTAAEIDELRTFLNEVNVKDFWDEINTLHTRPRNPFESNVIELVKRIRV